MFRALTRPVIRSPEQGTDTIVWLGGAPEAIESSGLFWHGRRPRGHLPDRGEAALAMRSQAGPA